MRIAATAILALAATPAFAVDDPDLPGVSGRIAKDAPETGRLILWREAGFEPGWFNSEEQYSVREYRSGETFRFVGLVPGRYRLEVQGKGLQTWERSLDVFDDVAGVEVVPVPKPERADATFSGMLTLGFQGDLTKCGVSIDRVPAARYPDGSIRCVGLHPGPAWISVRYSDPRPLQYPDPSVILRHVPLTLVSGENKADIRLEPNEQVALVLRPTQTEGRIDALLTDLDPSPAKSPDVEEIAFTRAADGALTAHRWLSMMPDAVWFGDVGPALPLHNLARGPHRIRIHAAGYEPVDHDFDVPGPTKLELPLKPIAGSFVVPDIASGYWIVEERGAGGACTPIATQDMRVRAGGHDLPPPMRVFLTKGRHVLRAMSADLPPSAAVEVTAGDDHAARPITFTFPKGYALRGEVVTPSGTNIGGFELFAFALVGEAWERRPVQDVVVREGIRIAGLAPGRHRLAFDEAGKRVLAEFEIADADIEREFTYAKR